MTKTVAQKMGVKAGCRAYFQDAPKDVLDAMKLPDLAQSERLDGSFDYLHSFVKSQAELNERLSQLRAHLAPTGMLWVSWPKGRREGTDLVLHEVIRIAYDHGFVESTCLSVSEVWSGLKLTHPKAGKVYHNSYGQLPQQTK